MNILLLSAFWLLFQPAQSSGPGPSTPLRNTFAVATETVIDTAAAVDLNADDSHFDAQMKQLKQARETLSGMAGDAREKDIVDSANNLIFLVSACHIQAKNGAPTAKCQSQFTTARNRIMEAIGKHKTSGTWTDGPPS